MKIKKIKHKYKDFELNIENITLPDHAIVGLVGKNGAGKTTMMSILADFKKASDSFDIEGYDHKKILYIPSELETYDFLTVKEFIDFIFQYTDHPEEDLDTEQVIHLMDLDEKKDVMINDLSEGMRKKLTMAPLFIRKYELLILDEPFNSIDMEYIYKMKQILLEKKEKACILISSHILDTLADICDEIILIENGKVKKTIEDKKNVTELERELFETGN